MGENNKVFFTIVILHCVNYNTFLQNVCIQSPIYMVGIFMMIKIKQKTIKDPFTCAPLEED